MLKRNWNVILGSIVAIIILLGGIYFTYYTWTLGDNEGDYSVVCIGGHEYYRANFANKGFLGIRLTGDGRPLKCDNK